MDVIETRVSFISLFKLRGFQLYAPDLDRVFDNDEISNTLFRDSNLKNNSKLVLREPPKVKLDEDGNPIEESDEELDEEEGEDEMMEEGGEDEIDEMAEEGEAEMEDGEGQGEGDADGEAKD